MAEEEELNIPRTALNKMIRELVPNIRVANDARELILLCCTEFVHLIATEANDVCERQQKKTISPEHIMTALENLGLGEYCEEAEAVLQEAKQVAKQRRVSTKLENLGIPEEELLRQQQELFNKARNEQAQLLMNQWHTTQAQTQAMLQAQKSKKTDDDEYD